MAAAENGALTGGKVGGIGDVLHGLPAALAGIGHDVTVVTPAYGMFDKTTGAEHVGRLDVPFAGSVIDVDIHRIEVDGSPVTHLVFEHERISGGMPGRIYIDDPDRPFAADASKFACFCAAFAHYVADADERPDVVHLHDWHTALYLLHRAFDPRLSTLGDVRTVFTIHNLALQGIRPLTGDESSLRSWHPDLDADPSALVDPRYADCVNPMATGIRLADVVNTVSPTYAREILEPSDPDRGFVGGEGLETDLRRAADAGRLRGILNGCPYDDVPDTPTWQDLLAVFELAHARTGVDLAALDRWRERRPPHLLTSIGRIVDQKLGILLEPTSTAPTALEEILDMIGDRGLFVLLGTGDRALERRLGEINLN